MTKSQAKNFNRMLFALRRISRAYGTPDQLLREFERGEHPALGYDELLSMAYENIQAEASAACYRVRPIKLN